MMLTSPREDFTDFDGDEEDKDVIDQYKKLIRFSRNNAKQNFRNFAKTEISNKMNWGGNSYNSNNEKEEKILGVVNLVMKRLMLDKFVTQIRPHFLSALLMNSEETRDETDCSSVALVLYSRLIEHISKTSRSQTLVLNGKTTKKRVRTTLKLLDHLFRITPAEPTATATEKTSIASEQLSLFYRVASTTTTQKDGGEFLKPLFAFNVGITFKMDQDTSLLTALDFDVSASLFNRFEIEYLVEKKSPYQTAVQCIVERFEIFKDLLCAPNKMLEPLLGHTFVCLKYFSFINDLKKDAHLSETRFYDFLKNIKRALLCSTREINTLLRTLSIILLLLDLEDSSSSDAFNADIKTELESHLETFDSELLGYICEILHLEQFEVLNNLGLMINNKKEDLDIAFSRCTSFVCILMDSLFRWIEQKCKKASKTIVNSVEDDIDSENIVAVHLISLPEMVPDKSTIHSFGDLLCNASTEHAYSWALQYLVEDISTAHSKEGFIVTDPLMDILDGSSSREIIDFLFGSSGLLCSYPTISETTSYHDRKDAIDKVVHFFRNNSYYGLRSVNVDTKDGNQYIMDHSFGKFKYHVGSFFPKYINEGVQHQILKGGIPSVEISDLHKDFLHSMKKIFSPTALNSDPTFVTFFTTKSDRSIQDLSQQMIYSPIMLVSEVGEKSFDVILSKKAFWKSFHPLFYRRFPKDTALNVMVSKILLNYIGPQKSGNSQLLYFIGKTSVLLKRSPYETLRANAFEVMSEAAIVIQRQWRLYKLKKKSRDSIQELLLHEVKKEDEKSREALSSNSPPKREPVKEESSSPPMAIISRPTKLDIIGVSTTPLSEKKKKLQKSYVYGLAKRKEAIIKKNTQPTRKTKPPPKTPLQSISMVQAFIRGKLVASDHAKKVESCLKIQRLYREKKSKELELEVRKRKIDVIKKRNEQKKHNIEKYNRAARKIQKAWFHYKENFLQKQLIEAVIIIQRAWRAYKLKSSIKILLKIRREGERRRKEFEERERKLKDKELQVNREAQELQHHKQILFEKEKLLSKQQIADQKFKEKEEQVWNSLQEITMLIHSQQPSHKKLQSASQNPSLLNNNMPQAPFRYQNARHLSVGKMAPKQEERAESPPLYEKPGKKVSYTDLLKETYGSAIEHKKCQSIKKVNRTESEIVNPKLSSPSKVPTPQNKSTLITNLPKRIYPSKPTEKQPLNTSKYQPSMVIVPENSLKQLIDKNERKTNKTVNETWNNWNILIQELSNEFNPKNL